MSLAATVSRVRWRTADVIVSDHNIAASVRSVDEEAKKAPNRRRQSLEEKQERIRIIDDQGRIFRISLTT